MKVVCPARADAMLNVLNVAFSDHLAVMIRPTNTTQDSTDQSNPLFKITEHQGDIWILASVDIPPQTKEYQVRIDTFCDFFVSF